MWLLEHIAETLAVIATLITVPVLAWDGAKALMRRWKS